MCFFVFPTVKGFFLKKFKKVNPFKKADKSTKKNGNITHFNTQKTLQQRTFRCFFKIVDLENIIKKDLSIREIFSQGLLYFSLFFY